MATATLVESDLEVGRRIIAALTQVGIAVTVAFWAHVPQIDEWQFFIATPLVDSVGHRTAYDQVLRALKDEGIDADAPWRRIFLRSPKEPILKSLGKQAASSAREGFVTVNSSVGGRFVEDAYVYGTIFVVKAGSLRPNRREYFSVLYTPQSGPRPAMPPLRMAELEDVREFLERQLQLDSFTVAQLIDKLRSNQSIIIPVALSTARIRALGLS